MNGLSLKTVIPGRNKIPGIYSSNFDPTAHSTMPMLTRLAIGALVIQTATLDPQCVESCTLALWIKTCPADCDDSTWQSINIGPVVIPPDIHCVSGALVGNVLHLVLTDGSTIDVDLSPLATDNNTFLTTLALAGTVLTATLNSGATVTVDLAPLIPVDVKLSALALAGTVLTATLTDGSTVTVDLAPLVYAPPAPVVIPPADAAAWADPLNPTDVEIQTWLTANPQAAGTLVILQGGGSVASPDHVWEVGPGAVLTHIEKPSAAPVIDLCAELNTLDTATDALVPATADVSYVRADGSCGRAPMPRLLTVQGVSPLVINPTNSIANWPVVNVTESTPITTLAVTNPSAINPLNLDVRIYHGAQANVASMASPKTQTFSLYSLISFDPGTGTLALASLTPGTMSADQISVQAVDHDLATPTGAGNQNASTLTSRVVVPPGGTVTLRAQSTLTIRDPHAAAVAWSVCQISVYGQVMG